jgi:hypothetical protein
MYKHLWNHWSFLLQIIPHPATNIKFNGYLLMCKLNRTSVYYKDLKKGSTKHTLILVKSIHLSSVNTWALETIISLHPCRDREINEKLQILLQSMISLHPCWDGYQSKTTDSSLRVMLGSRRVWLSRTGIAMLLRSGIGGSLRGLQSLPRGDRREMQLAFTQDRLCMV